MCWSIAFFLQKKSTIDTSLYHMFASDFIRVVCHLASVLRVTFLLLSSFDAACGLLFCLSPISMQHFVNNRNCMILLYACCSLTDAV